jgi:glycosyltransferase involved in cell wall biosynthesis
VIYDSLREPGRLWDLDLADIDSKKSLGTLRLRRNLSLDAGQTVYFHTLLFAQIVLFKPDILIANELGSRTFWAVVYKLLNPKTKLIFWLTLSEWTERNRGSARGTLRRRLFKHGDAFVVSSQSAKRFVHAWKPDAEVFVAPQSASMPVAATDLAPMSLPLAVDETVKVTFVGNSSRRKNLSNLLAWLDDWSVASDTKVKLSVAGVAPPATAAICNPNLTVDYLGYLNQAALIALFDRSDVMAFPTLEDEWGLVVNESLARGCPVLGSIYSEAVVELVREGSNGWQFDPLDRGTFFVAMDKFAKTYRDKNAYSKVRRSAIESAEGASVEKFASTFVQATKFCLQRESKD